MSAPVLQGGSC